MRLQQKSEANGHQALARATCWSAVYARAIPGAAQVAAEISVRQRCPLFVGHPCGGPVHEVTSMLSAANVPSFSVPQSREQQF